MLSLERWLIAQRPCAISLEILCNALSFFEISGNLNYYLKKKKKAGQLVYVTLKAVCVVYALMLSLFFPLPSFILLSPRGGCLCQMSVFSKGWESGGQPQPVRATGGQIQRQQGYLPRRHQKGKTHSKCIYSKWASLGQHATERPK